MKLILAALAAFCLRSGVAAEPPVSALAADNKVLWSLVILPQSGSASSWVHWASTASPLHLTVALSPRELRKVPLTRESLRSLKNLGHLEIAGRLNDDPPLPLIDDLELALNYLPAGQPLFGLKMSYKEDLSAQIAQARSDYKNLLGEDLKGFVPGNGSLSLAVADALKGQNFIWALGAFPESEWKRGSILTASSSQEKTFWVYGAHALSEALHDARWYRGAPKKSAAETRQIVESMMAEVVNASRDGIIPIVVFDEKRSAVPLDAFLAECAAAAKVPGAPRMILGSDAGYVADARSQSNTLQIWPYSWSWITGIGDPQGPGLAAWVGDPAKNSAWKWLAEAREKIELYKNSGAADLKKLERALNEIYSAESGDYFEWFGNLEDEPSQVRNALRAKQREKELYFKATLLNVYRHLNLTAPEAFRTGTKIAEALLPQGATAQAELPIIEPEEKPFPTAVQMTLAAGGAAWTPSASDGVLKKFAFKPGSRLPEETVDFHFTIQDAPGLESAVVDLYIDINRREAAGKTALLQGRNASVSSLNAWEYVLTCQRSAASKAWECELYRSNSSRPIFKAAARANNGKSKLVSWDVSVPKNLLGKEPLRWGYLSCIIEKEGRPIMDFLSPVRHRQKILAELGSLSENAQAPSAVVLPLLRAEPD